MMMMMMYHGAKVSSLSRIHDHTDLTTGVYIPVNKLVIRSPYNIQTVTVVLYLSSINSIYNNCFHCYGNTHYNTLEWFYLKKEGVCPRDSVHAADTTRVQPNIGLVCPTDINWLFV
jgi:hypothetical protein